MIFIPRMVDGNIGLAPFTIGIEKLFFRWMQDSRIYTAMGDLDEKPFTEADATSYVSSHGKDTWIIVVKIGNNWKPIGYTGLFVRARHGVGIFRIAVCEEEYCGKGYSDKATSLMLEWAIVECGLFAIHLSVSANNLRAISLYERAGFTKCGLFEGSRIENGERYNEVLMEYTRNIHNDKIGE